MHANRKALLIAGSVAVMTLFFALTASAQVARVFLSGTGNDTNDCSDVTTPCRSLQGAINQCPVNGEIIVLSSGGFGTANITKPLTINAPDGVVAFNARTISVNIAASDTVVIRGLSMQGAVFGDGYGVEFNTGGALIVENCIVDGFSSAGIGQVAAGGTMIINHCEFRNGGGDGIWLIPQSATATFLTVEDSRFIGNAGAGLDLSGTTNSVIKDSVITGSIYGVIAVATTAGDPKVTVDRCVIAHNTSSSDAAGIRAQDFRGPPYDVTVRVTNSSIYGNTTGLVSFGSSIVSYGTNQLYNNGTNGTFNSTIAQQ
ncbi:MAG: hypothetical protein DMF57_00840 [Acidobacteria bacterium]|nr:MAG: hypothetical protein DMF57_00840 [Acidobacteriota bacterium]